MVIDAGTYQWSDRNWKRPAFRDLVIYELHVGTFTAEGTFRGAIEKLNQIRACGVTAIELMPIADFAGGRNWGYDGVYWFAPSHAYGHPDELRALVNAAHCAGLAVILDVVYNHFGPDGNHLHSYIGDYLDETTKTPWGGAIRYGQPEFAPLRQLAISNPAYWMREFHIDGFRLDATHAIFDASPRHILQDLTDSIHSLGGFAIAEDPRNDARLVTAATAGGFGFDAVWADDFHHIVRVPNTAENEGYFADFKGTLAEAVDTLHHGWLYRGQKTPGSGQSRGTDCAHLSPESFVHCISNHDQTGNHAFGERLSHRILPSARRAADALLCLTPYTPMLFMGQEWAASTPFLFFTDHHPDLGRLIVEGRRDEFRHFAAFREPAALEKLPNPQAITTFEASKLVWEERERAQHAQTLALYTECLHLRARHVELRPRGRRSWKVCSLAIGVGALRFEAELTIWLVVFDLQGGHEGTMEHEEIFVRPAGFGSWRCLLSTNESRFGGSGACALTLETMQAKFEPPETIILRSDRASASEAQ